MGGGGGGVVKDVGSKAELDEALRGASEVVVHFWAFWCEASKQMDQVFGHLATDFPHALFLRVGSLLFYHFLFRFSVKGYFFDLIQLRV